MRLRDFANPERGPAALVRLALCPLALVVAFPLVAAVVSQLRGGDLLLLLLGLALVSPLAYLIREARRSCPHRQLGRRGAERTPLMPPNEENQ